MDTVLHTCARVLRGRPLGLPVRPSLGRHGRRINLGSKWKSVKFLTAWKAGPKLGRSLIAYSCTVCAYPTLKTTLMHASELVVAPVTAGNALAWDLARSWARLVDDTL